MTPLFGHHDAVTAFRAALDTGRLHHAWLIAGPEGVGKALFADKAALRVLAQATGPVNAPGLDVPDDHFVSNLLSAGSHPDFVRLERLTSESGTDLARSIKIDQVRGLRRLFDTKPSISNWRVVVINAADDLERPGAGNALLKILEEPPPDTLFLLVSHTPERLMPTVRSRCRLLRLSPLADDAMTAALQAALPDAEAEEIEALVRVGDGSPGRAIAWRGLDIAALDRDMDALVRQGDRSNARRSALAGSLALKSAQGRYEAFLARAPSRIASEAKGRGGNVGAEAIRLWERASSLAGSARRHSLDPHSVVFELAGMLAALAEEAGRDAA